MNASGSFLYKPSTIQTGSRTVKFDPTKSLEFNCSANGCSVMKKSLKFSCCG